MTGPRAVDVVVDGLETGAFVLKPTAPGSHFHELKPTPAEEATLTEGPLASVGPPVWQFPVPNLKSPS